MFCSINCFVLFCGVTLYKGISGAASCGCFGNVHVNPWITLFLIDLPAVILLGIFRPTLEKQRIFYLPHWLEPVPKLSVLSFVFLIGFTSVAVSSPVLIFNEPAMVTTQYEVLEPSEWIGKELPILEHIDIGEELKTGNWLVVLYHHDCPSCAEVIPKIEKMAEKLEGKVFLQIAFVEMPPYGEVPISENTLCKVGRLPETKKWFGTTPIVVLLQKNWVKQAWEGENPGIDILFNSFLE